MMEGSLMTTPDWLTKHGGALRPGPVNGAWYVYLDGEPQYSLTPEPAGGKHSCRVMQTINGRRLDSGRVHATLEEAMQGGLEDLRKTLGW
jgi:hypothetical protein